MALVKTFIPDRWRAGGAGQAPVCAATSLNFTAVCEADGGFDAIPEPMAQVVCDGPKYKPENFYIAS